MSDDLVKWVTIDGIRYKTQAEVADALEAKDREIAAERERADRNEKALDQAALFLDDYLQLVEEMKSMAARNGVSPMLHTNAEASKARYVRAAIDAARKGEEG